MRFEAVTTVHRADKIPDTFPMETCLHRGDSVQIVIVQFYFLFFTKVIFIKD